MKNIIQINLGTDHALECAEKIIGRSGEGLVSRLEITVPEALNKYGAYIDFEKPNGETLRTPRLEAENGVAYYDVPQYLLVENGEIKVQLVFASDDGKIWKSSKKKYTILKSINADDEIPEREDFITEAQKLINELNQEVEQIAYALANDENFAQTVIDAVGGQTSINTINGLALRFFVGKQSEYDALTNVQKQNLFAIITDDTAKEAVQSAIAGLQTDLSALEWEVTQIANGTTSVKKAESATHAETADEATHAETAGSAGSATEAGHAITATKAERDQVGNVINKTYAMMAGDGDYGNFTSGSILLAINLTTEKLRIGQVINNDDTNLSARLYITNLDSKGLLGDKVIYTSPTDAEGEETLKGKWRILGSMSYTGEKYFLIQRIV